MAISYHCQKHLPNGLIFKYKNETMAILEKILEAIYTILKLDLNQDESYLKGIEMVDILKINTLEIQNISKTNR